MRWGISSPALSGDFRSEIWYGSRLGSDRCHEIKPSEKVQKAKTKAIEVLSKYRIEKAKLNSENTGDELVDNWMMAVLEKEAENNE